MITKGGRTTTSLGALIIPLLVLASVWYLTRSEAPWFSGPAYAAEGLLNAEVAVAGVTTEPTPFLDVSGVNPETYWVPVGATDAAAWLVAQNIPVHSEDELRAFPNLNLGLGGSIKIYRAQAILVTDAGVQTLIRSWQTTVGEVLAEHSIELGEQDKVEPAADQSSLTPDRLTPVTVTITRVTETDLAIPEAIPYKTVVTKDAAVEKGVKEVTQRGQNGTKVLTYRVRRENGIEVSRKLIDTAITVEPVTELITEGTKVKVYGTGTATWYTKRLNHVAAHNGLAVGTKVKVINTATGKSTVVTVVGGGLYTDAVIDLSYDAFAEIGSPSAGRLAVRLEKVYE